MQQSIEPRFYRVWIPKESCKGMVSQSLFTTVFFSDQVSSGLSEKLYILEFTKSYAIYQKWEDDEKFYPEGSQNSSQVGWRDGEKRHTNVIE